MADDYCPPVISPPPEYPPGLHPLPQAVPPFTGNRRQRFDFSLQARNGAPKGPLDGVHIGGTVEYVYDARLGAGGKITVQDTGQHIDWLNDRILISMTISEGGAEYVIPLGLFLPTAPIENWEGGHRHWDVELHSKLLVLDQDAFGDTYALPPGTVVTTAVRTLIEGTGEAAGSITDNPAKTLAGPMWWEPGTPKLTIVNDLLDAAGYFPLQVDGLGNYRAVPYVLPADRPIVWTFEDGANAIFEDAFTRDQDIFEVPNRVIAVQQGSGDTIALVAQVDNTDPSSPFSIPSRGGRVIVKVFTGVEATDMASLTSFAQRELEDSQRPTALVTLSHAPLNLTVHEAVQLIYSLGSLSGRYVIDRTTVTLDPTALSESVLRQVISYTGAPGGLTL